MLGQIFQLKRIPSRSSISSKLIFEQTLISHPRSGLAIRLIRIYSRLRRRRVSKNTSPQRRWNRKQQPRACGFKMRVATHLCMAAVCQCCPRCEPQLGLNYVVLPQGSSNLSRCINALKPISWFLIMCQQFTQALPFETLYQVVQIAGHP